jgi:hypothetical protein
MGVREGVEGTKGGKCKLVCVGPSYKFEYWDFDGFNR